MSRVIPLSTTFAPNNQIHISSVGNILIDSGTGSNYALTDINLLVVDGNAIAVGAVALTLQLVSTTILGFTLPILTYQLVLGSVPAGFLSIQQSVVRTFPSALILPANSQLFLDVLSLSNLSVANVTLDISGFTF